MSKQTYDASDIEVVEMDVDKIKKRPDMYIGYSNTMGFKHCIKEVQQNSIDEYVIKNGQCDLIDITYDEDNKEISIKDNGRGIPHEKLIQCATILQASGKFKKGKDNSYRFAAGKNGVGLKCANALANYCIVESKRDGVKYTVRFKEGYVESEEKTDCGKKEHGTSVTFQPNEDILGKIDLTPDDLMDLLDTMGYLSSARTHVTMIPKKGKVKQTEIWHKHGIEDLLNELVKRPMIKPIRIYGEGEDKIVDIILTYVSDINDMNIVTKENNMIVSFANYCTTVDGGTHVEGFKRGIAKAFPKFIRESILNKKEKESLNINNDDIMDGLVAIVNLNHEDATFVGQVKEKLGNEDCIKFVRDVVSKELSKWFKDNSTEATKIGKYIRDIAKVRARASAEKKAVVKNNNAVTNVFTGKPKGYDPATGKKHLELYIVEGDSAAGSMKQGRDKSYQAIFKLRGVTKNTLDKPLNEILENDEIRGLVEVIGTNIGRKFDADKCIFDLIIIATDADRLMSA